MTTLTADPLAHKVTMLTTAGIFLKFLLTTLYQGGARFKGGTRPPEDASFKGLARGVPQDYGLGGTQLSAKTKENDIRWQRIVLNDLENIPIGLVVAWGSLFSCYSVNAHCSLLITWGFARLFHTIFYAKSIQPHRAVAWFIAVVCVAGLAVNGVLGVIA